MRETERRVVRLISDLDAHLIAEGTHYELYRKLGAHPDADGVAFAVWAPNAKRVSVVGDFNDWNLSAHPMEVRPDCGVWEGYVEGARAGQRYKFAVWGSDGSLLPLKADPFAVASELRPATASVISPLLNEAPPKAFQGAQHRAAPITIYEVHLGSWRRRPEEGHRFLTYRELAAELIPYVKEMGFTHLELLPPSEHPFDGSWGYQPLGLYAVTSRFGSGEDFRALVGAAHDAGIGVFVDWVAGHFPNDEHGLARFDGTHLYEHADPRQGWHPDWHTCVFNFGRREVTNYLLANALFWLAEHGVDGLRVDAVASMLYLDYSRNEGEWVPNRYGGRENLDAIDFLRRTNEVVYSRHPNAVTIAEESTAWPQVSAPTYLGGLGFGYKWNMGWMHDTLAYIAHDSIHRKYHQDQLTFSLLYAFSENYVLPLSHDEVVHGKGSIFGKMPGDRWQRFANVRLLYGYMYTHPGKKLLFMGNEFAQEREWNHDESLDWHLLEDPSHAGVQRLVRDLNALYAQTPALYEQDAVPEGFQWLCSDAEDSVIAYVRRGRNPQEFAAAICNFTPVVRYDYHVGVPACSALREAINTDASIYGGSNVGNFGTVEVQAIPAHGQTHSISVTLPPLAALILVPS
jgi:1,4-alpha-glucan branching enzyme